ncbi:hypothetical protein AZE42_03936 [Rhizopogon vesiculosus]|uniref:Uncharacterized protein n=1 Tax=Rhizopogon vesiculosus TaxID=180088 RepID=A0A1J8QRZ6_9AGAM|nr:hypothetical protein AZE42_03936 [Rhizopogon vesiculosus]
MTVFFVVLKTDLLPVEVSNDASIFQIFRYLKSESDVGHRILGRTLYDQYKYYKLKNPVPVPRRITNSTSAATIQACLHQSNWEEVSAHDILDVQTPISARNVYIVIQPGGNPTQTAIADLEANHGDIFSCLQITVSNLQRWTMQDVENNLEGGRLWPPGDAGRPAAIVAIEESLARRRTFTVMDSQAQQNKDYQHAREYKTHFRDIYQETLNSPGDVINREFASFFHVLRCFDEDSYRIESEGSSALKASNFVVYFISPPFFASYNEHFEFKQEKAWGFPIFLTTEGQPDAWCQFRPRSDLMVSLRSFLCPLLISEVVSQNDEADRYRMLLQAIAVARAGQYLIRQGAQIQFFVVAIYLKANLIAERYIIANIGGTREVSISQKDFTLTTADGAVAFLREMYNLVAMVDILAENLDNAKKDILSEENRWDDIAVNT